jgi:hypothetical protein
MACPGGCIGGAGQPVSRDRTSAAARPGLYDVDKNLDLHKSQENHFVTECYQRHLGEIGGKNAHRLLHTHYQAAGASCRRGDPARRRPGGEKLKVNVCAGTNCFLKGSQQIIRTTCSARCRRRICRTRWTCAPRFVSSNATRARPSALTEKKSITAPDRSPAPGRKWNSN